MFGIQALITLESIRDLTRLTDELRVRIEGTGKVFEGESGVGVRDGDGQVVLGGGGGEREDGEEVEVVSFGFLVLFCIVFGCGEGWGLRNGKDGRGVGRKE